MIKKKSFDFKNPVFIGSIVVSLGIIFTFLTKVVDFLRVPDAIAAEAKRIDKLEESTQQIAEVLKEQSTINKYIQEQDAKDKKHDQELPVLSPDGKFYLDKETGKWKKAI